MIDGAGIFEFKDQPQPVREEILANLATFSPEAAGAITALNRLSVLFAYSLPGPDGRNPLWAGMGYPGPVGNPPSDARKTLEVITVAGETTLEADVIVVGSGSGGGVAAAVLAEAGKRVIIVEGFIEKVNAIPIGPGGTPVFSAHQMCSAKLGSDPQTSVAKPNGELHDVAGVWIADASGMPTCSGVNPMVSTMALARRTAVNLIDRD